MIKRGFYRYETNWFCGVAYTKYIWITKTQPIFKYYIIDQYGQLGDKQTEFLPVMKHMGERITKDTIRKECLKTILKEGINSNDLEKVL